MVLGATPSRTQRYLCAPFSPSSSQPVSFDAGTSHTCAALADGSLHCWGLNSTASWVTEPPPSARHRFPLNCPVDSVLYLLPLANRTPASPPIGQPSIALVPTTKGNLVMVPTTSRNAYGSSIFNNGMISQSWNLVEGYESQISVLAAGWGSIQVQPPNLPAGFSYSSSTLHYDGGSPLTNGTISITATSQANRFKPRY